VSSKWRELVLLKESYHVITADLERAAVAGHIQRFCEAIVEARAAPGAVK
jgi:esterase/lipase